MYCSLLFLSFIALFIIFAFKKNHRMDKETKRDNYKEAGKYCLDMSKLVFGGIILAGIMQLGVNNVLLFSLGLAATACLALLGFMFNTFSNPKK